jgi:hypothetical protein
MFGGCSEQKSDDLLNKWLHLMETPVRGMEQSEKRDKLMLGRSLDSALVDQKQV